MVLYIITGATLSRSHVRAQKCRIQWAQRHHEGTPMTTSSNIGSSAKSHAHHLKLLYPNTPITEVAPRQNSGTKSTPRHSHHHTPNTHTHAHSHTEVGTFLGHRCFNAPKTNGHNKRRRNANCQVCSTKSKTTPKSDAIQIDTPTPRNDHADSKSNVRLHRNSHARKNKIKHSKLCLACHWNTHARARCQLHLLCSAAQILRRKLFKDAKRQQLRILP